MFNIGFSEMLILGVLALILIGPKQLPEVARTLGRFLNELKRSSEGLKEELGVNKIQEDLRRGVERVLEEKTNIARDTKQALSVEQKISEHLPDGHEDDPTRKKPPTT